MAVAGATVLLSGCLGSSGSSSSSSSQSAAPVSAQLTLANGEVQGIVEESALVWHGIPYAAAPVDDLRWRAPQPPVDWDGVLDATERASECVQAETTIR